MGQWIIGHWDNPHNSGLSRRDRRSGEYRAYVPNPLSGSTLRLSPDIEALAAQAEQRVRTLTISPAMTAVSRFLLRSEAIASSRIEGIAPSAHKVALAELGQYEEVKGLSAQARTVANNVTLVRAAVEEMNDTAPVDVERLLALHRSLLPDSPEHHGIRTVQNWREDPRITPLRRTSCHLRRTWFLVWSRTCCGTSTEPRMLHSFRRHSSTHSSRRFTRSRTVTAAWAGHSSTRY